MQDKHAIRQRGDLRSIDLLLSGGLKAILMQLRVHLVSRWERPGGIAARVPAPPKPLIVLIAALGAGAMARRQRGRLVKEEQPGVASRRHDLAVAATELEDADNPAASLVKADNPPLLVV